MTRLLLDENFPLSGAAALARAGHDVLAVAVAAPGISDREVLALARAQQRCLVTFDADFGDLLFRQGEPPPLAVIYLRLHPILADAAAALTLQALQQVPDGHFVVATPDGLRRRPLQGAGTGGAA